MTLTRVPLDGEPPTDRAYQAPSGRVWRVRAVPAVLAATAPLNGGGDEPVARGYALQLSVALLDAQGAVARDTSGRVMVMQSVMVTIDIDALQRADFDPDALAAAQIAQLIEQAEVWAGNVEAAADFLARWVSGAPAGPDSHE